MIAEVMGVNEFHYLRERIQRKVKLNLGDTPSTIKSLGANKDSATFQKARKGC